MPSGPQLPQLYLELSLMNYLRGLEVPRGPLLHSFFPNALHTLPVCEGPDIQRDGTGSSDQREVVSAGLTLPRRSCFLHHTLTCCLLPQ